MGVNESAMRYESSAEKRRDGPHSFRDLLATEFSERKAKNPRYSLRAFARNLDLESSHLSKLLNGKRPLNRALAKKLATKLNLSLEQLERLLRTDSTVIKKHGRVMRPYKSISVDQFATVEDWRHYAILELMKVKDFEPSTSWVANALGISNSEAEGYIKRLQRVGLLRVDKNGSWHDVSEGNSTHVLTRDEFSEIHVRTQLRLLELSKQALIHLPLAQRDHSSMMMATHTRKLKMAKKKIAKFRRELSRFLEGTSEKNTVFQLTIGLFPVLGRGK